MTTSAHNPRARLRVAAPWLALGVLALLLWYAVGPWFIRREIVAHIDGVAPTSGWSLNWTQQGKTQAHGVWLDFSDPGESELVIEPSGVATEQGKAFEFWLYIIKADNGAVPDLKALIGPGAKPTDGWVPFEQGPGIIYVGQKPGRLVVPLSGRSATISYAKTDHGGDVTFHYRGRTISVNAHSPTTVGENTIVPDKPVPVEAADLHQVLPVYSVGEVRLSWHAPVGSAIMLGSPRVVFTLLGHKLFERAATPESVADAEADAGVAGSRGWDAKWTATGSSPALRLRADFGLGFGVHALGAIAAFAWLAFLWLAGRALVRSAPALANSPHAGVACVFVVASIVVLVNFGLAWRAPLFVTPDGLDYIDAADGLANGGTFDRFPSYKAPGLSVMLAGAMLIWRDFLDGFGWVQAGLGVTSAWLAYGLVRSRASRPWALGAALLVGVHPTLLTYECYLLREAPSATVVLAVSLVLVRLTDGLRERGRGGWGLTLLLAALCAAGAYLRENMQLLLLFVPGILLVAPWKLPFKWRAVRAATVLLVAAGMLLPRVVPIAKEFGNIGVVRPKAQCNRALAAWSNALSDGNDTAFFSEEEWESLRKAQSPGRITDYDFTFRLYDSAGARNRSGADKPIPGDIKHYSNTERESRNWVNEANARAPLTAAGDSAIAFVNQLGLWNIHGNIAAASDEYYSKPLRGDAPQYSTNFVFDTNAVLRNERLGSEQERLKTVIARSRRSTEDLANSSWPDLMNEWFWAFRAARPVFAALFLVGFVMAVRRQDFALAGAGAIVLLSILGAAVVVATPTDRFGVPFIPVVVCLAVYAAASWRGAARQTG